MRRAREVALLNDSHICTIPVNLYRAFSTTPGEDIAVFHDATASFKDAIAFATRLMARQPTADIWIDEESWPTLSLARYYWYLARGSHEGFGVNFQNRSGHRIASSRAVWPEAAVLKFRAEEFLVSIPPASDFVLVASPKYSGKYRCEVVVRSRYALAQAQELRASTFGGEAEEMLMRHALPMWLERARPDVQSPSAMPRAFQALLDPWVGDFIERGEASVFCLACKKTIDSVQEGMRNERSAGNRGEWTSSWRCPTGHDLYAEDHDVRLFRRPK